MLRKLKIIGCLITACLFLPSAGHASGETGIEIVASCSPWPPYVTEGNSPGGILVDYVEELLASFGYKTRIEIYPWKRAIDAARNGDVDVIFCAEAGQAQNYGLEYEFPILISDTVLLSHRDYPLPTDQLWEHRIALGAGYWYGDEFENRRDEVDIMEVVDDFSILRMVASRRADGGLMEKSVADALIQAHPELGRVIHISNTPVATQTFYFATSTASRLNMEHIRHHLAKAKPTPLKQQIRIDTN